MSRLTTGQQALIARQRAGASPTGPLVYYRAETEETVTLTGKAWVGRTPFRVQDEGGSRLVWSDRDYMIPVEDLAIDGTRFQPAEGDWLEETLASPEGVVKWVVRPYNNEPEWRFSDPGETVYRVHTKRFVSAE